MSSTGSRFPRRPSPESQGQVSGHLSRGDIPWCSTRRLTKSQRPARCRSPEWLRELRNTRADRFFESLTKTHWGGMNVIQQTRREKRMLNIVCRNQSQTGHDFLEFLFRFRPHHLAGVLSSIRGPLSRGGSVMLRCTEIGPSVKHHAVTRADPADGHSVTHQAKQRVGEYVARYTQSSFVRSAIFR